MSENSNPIKPVMVPYDRHIFVCVGEKCHTHSEGMEVYEYLKKRLKEQGAHPAIKRVKRSQSQCLRICQSGPIGVVYPEGVWYCHLTKEKIERILEEHLKEGKPVKDWVFYPEPDKC